MAERALALAPGGELQPQDLMLPELPAPAHVPPPVKAALAEAPAAAAAEGPRAAPGFDLAHGVPSDLEAYLGAVEREAIRAALARTGHNRTAAAQLLGISFRQMRYRMRRLGLK